GQPVIVQQAWHLGQRHRDVVDTFGQVQPEHVAPEVERTVAERAAGTTTALDHGAIGEEMNEVDAGGGGGQRFERPQQRPRRRAGAADEHAVAAANAPYRAFGRHGPLTPLGIRTFPARPHAIRLRGGRSWNVAHDVPGDVSVLRDHLLSSVSVVSSQDRMSISAYIVAAVVKWSTHRWSLPRPRWQWATRGRMPSSAASSSAAR